MNFGQKLKELRRKHGMSQTDLGKIMDVHIMTISRWETSVYCPNINQVAELSNLFRVTSDYLLGLDNDNGKQTADLYNCNAAFSGSIIEKDKNIGGAGMDGSNKFETFVDMHSGVFKEYLSSIGTKLAKNNPEYQAANASIKRLYGQYPKVLGVLDSEEACVLNVQECKALVEILRLRNKITAIEAEAVYFRGCYDGVRYLKKAGIL